MAVRGKHGAMLAGRYRLLEQLGEGGMGSVWKAEDLQTHSHVAVKIVDPDVARLEFNLGRFLREAKTLASLSSPNVVQVLDYGSDSDAPYLVMELLEGQTLGRRLSEQGRMSLSETNRVLHDVCAAMALVHEQGLIHRDLKPENIFLCNAGDLRVTKVVDFGIAKSLRGDMSASMKTRTGHMLGTPSYMSPEQCRGLKDIDHRADLWAIGVIAYECLVGKVPFEGEVLGDLLLRICMDPLPVPSERAKGLPSAFDAWFAKAVARDRSLRFQSARELASSLSELSTALGMAVTVSREPSPPSGPSVSKLVASAVATAAVRQPLDTETNTSVGVRSGAARRMDPRTRVLAVAGVAACALAGLWARGGKRDPAGTVANAVQSLRAPYEVTPKAIQPRVPSGRRWSAAPAQAAEVAPGPSRASAPSGVRGGMPSGAELVSSTGGPPRATSSDAATAEPGNHGPSLPTRDARPIHVQARDLQPLPAGATPAPPPLVPSAMAPPRVASPHALPSPAESARAPAPAAPLPLAPPPSPINAAPAPARPLRGTFTMPSPRPPAAEAGEAGIRRSR